MRIIDRVRSFFQETLPKFSIKYPWIVAVVFILIISFFGYQLPNIYIDTDINKLTTGGEEETKAIETAARDFYIRDPLYIVLLGDMNEPDTWQRAADLVKKMRDIPDVLQVLSPLDTSYFLLAGFNVYTLPVAARAPTTLNEIEQFRSRLDLSPNGKFMISHDNSAMLIEVYIRSSYSSRGKKTVAQLEQMLKTEWGDKNFHITGTCYLAHASDQSIRRDVITLFPFAALIVALVLFFSFKNWLGILIPGATVLVSLIVSLGWMAWWGYPLTIVSVVLPIMLIVTGSADGIHILNKYQEELQQTNDKYQAIFITMNEMVPPCIMTSLTTAVGFLSLRTSSVIPVRDFGLFAAIGVLTALIFALVGIPALLAILPAPQQKTKVKRSTFYSHLLEWMSNWVVEHTSLVLVIGTAVFILSVVGINYLTVEANIARYFRSSSSVAEGIRIYEDKFGGSAQVLIVVDTNKPKGALEPEFLPLLAELEDYVKPFPLVSSTVSMASMARDFSPDGKLHGNLVALAFKQLPSAFTGVFLSRDQQQKAVIYVSVMSAETTKVAETLSKIESGLGDLIPEEMTVTVTGIPKIFHHHMQRFSESQIKSLIGSIITVLVLLVVFHGSLILGCLALLPLIFTIGANFGLMGWMGIPLDAGTVLIGSIVIGIGIDYSIHLISRVIREQKSGKDLRTACQWSITTAGHAIMINAITLIAGFLVLCFSVFSTLAIFGFLMALAMFVSSTASVTVLPAILQSFDKLKGGSKNA